MAKIADQRDDFLRIGSIVANQVGAKAIGAIFVAEIIAEIKNGEFIERHYIVASEQTRQCMTHKVLLGNDGRSELIWGHYYMDRQEALEDMVLRSANQIGIKIDCELMRTKGYV